MSSVKIGLSLGDPGGIGPEVTLKALFTISSLPKADYVLFGSRSIIEKEINKFDLGVKIPDYDPKKGSSLPQITLYDIPYPLNSLKSGYPCKENGEISFTCFKKAVKEAKRGFLDAVVTAPISKESWKLANINWAGHTEYLCQDYPEAIMSFFSNNLNVALFTHHMALKEALKKIKKKDLGDFFLRLDKFAQKATKKRFHLLVPGLNPHAGENGLMGKEEITEIRPAINAAKESGVQVSGPFPPDTVFKKAYKDNSKIVASLFHDQGLIAFKIVSFNEGVNVTLGLPFIRTSPDHGTAFDIVGKGSADPTSMFEAIKLAVQFSLNYRINNSL
jgi:4-hydroxythreonine-4-phosphate dehydrogenase